MTFISGLQDPTALHASQPFLFQLESAPAPVMKEAPFGEFSSPQLGFVDRQVDAEHNDNVEATSDLV